MAEIELNVMVRRCLAKCIEDINLLRSELSAWEIERNNDETFSESMPTTSLQILKVIISESDILAVVIFRLFEAVWRAKQNKSQ